ncbi:Bacterio-opsin activator HTH domain protein [Halovivax asiaticus JCM 14624]|uniref:Bacterio-opsin activator HTH domain protein n=1 Tax=Halovivax asiaticus JCM 14624 TaxID=1227490 RepID=M0BIW3_9EURY|nr:helix-turn-helix domain-containing protein [Halovivax asiaticus]ELZ10800.1 Bacterio-opsin activator HTH domain protein [Halovivax asiaticus JCM 14624]
MKRVRLTVHPGGLDLPAAFEAVTGAREPFAEVEVVNWNVGPPDAAFLLRVRGDLDRFEAALATDPAVEDRELVAIDSSEGYCFVAGVGSSDARALWEPFARGSLMTVPPAEWNGDGSYTFAVVGRDADIQAAVEAVPDVVRVEIESVGGERLAADSVVRRLTTRQREAVQRAIELGYYDSPREATATDVADALGCATSTAAAHLRKAEATLVCGLFDG